MLLIQYTFLSPIAVPSH
jgi:hypothetical protein